MPEDDDFEEEYEPCEECGGEGVIGHDCGEDICCCADPTDNIDCQNCGGYGSILVRQG